MTEKENGRWLDYETRLARVLDYIHDHLQEDLDLNRIAEVACFSPYHWHRIYYAMVGEPVAATVKRLRMHHAAGRLIRTQAPMQEIAKASGFAAVQSFSRAFRASFGVPPGEYRKDDLQRMYEVQIRQIPTATAMTCEHRGSYMNISRAFEKLYGWLAVHDSLTQAKRMVAFYYDDPAAVPEEQLRSRAGVVMAGGIPAAAPFEKTDIYGGTYAVLLHKGPYAELARAYHWLYGEWLPQSGKEAADAPAMEEYLNTPREVPPTELLTEICLPLR